MKIACFLICMCLYLHTFCQDTSKVDSSKGPITDLFVLNTCAPSQFALFKKNDDINRHKYVSARKLSINVNRLSSFRIVNINPLRYNYYINNELVTQFMNDGILTPTNNTYLKGTYLPEREIQTVKVFTSGFQSSNQKTLLADQKKIINLLQDTLDGLQAQIDNIDDSIFQLGYTYDYFKNQWVEPKTSTSQELNKIRKQFNNLFSDRNNPARQRHIAFYTNKIVRASIEFEKMIANFPINNNNIDFLNYDSSKYLTAYMDNKSGLRTIIREVDTFKIRYDSLKRDFNKVASLLNSVDTQKKYSPTIYDKLNEQQLNIVGMLTKYGYPTNALPNNFSSEVREFMLNKKYQTYEIFLLKLSTDAGKLLQDKFYEYSQDLNSLYYQNCLDPSDTLLRPDSIKQNINDIFKFTQDLSADFAVFVNYFDLDSKGFENTVNNINTYYTGLLNFLKYLNYLEKNNRVEFALPTHNNLKNIDIIRYKIDRDDKLTNSKQTYVYDLWIKGGVKIDFSAGLFLTGVLDYDYNKVAVYDSLSQPLTDSLYIKRKDVGSVNFAFGGMVNISLRLGASWITPSLSLGVAYSNSQKLQYLSAISLQVGKTERIILHGGFAGGLSQRIDDSQLTYTDIEKDKYIITQLKVKGDYNNFPIPYKDKFVCRPFFGISYNLSQRSALHAASGAGLDKYNSSLNSPSNSETSTP